MDAGQRTAIDGTAARWCSVDLFLQSDTASRRRLDLDIGPRARGRNEAGGARGWTSGRTMTGRRIVSAEGAAPAAVDATRLGGRGAAGALRAAAGGIVTSGSAAFPRDHRRSTRRGGRAAREETGNPRRRPSGGRRRSTRSVDGRAFSVLERGPEEERGHGSARASAKSCSPRARLTACARRSPTRAQVGHV